MKREKYLAHASCETHKNANWAKQGERRRVLKVLLADQASLGVEQQTRLRRACATGRACMVGSRQFGEAEMVIPRFPSTGSFIHPGGDHGEANRENYSQAAGEQRDVSNILWHGLGGLRRDGPGRIAAHTLPVPLAASFSAA